MLRLICLAVIFFPSLTTSSIVQNRHGCSIQTALPKLRRTTFDFSIELTKSFAEQSTESFVLAPHSVWNLLTVISEGAEGETLEELEKVLKIKLQPCIIDKYFEIEEGHYIQSPDITNKHRGFLILDQNVDVNNSFLENLDENTEVLILDFLKTESAVQTVNVIAANFTENTILEIVNEEDFHDRYFLLFDLVYFKAKWAVPFDKHLTFTSSFSDDYGSEAGTVEMMRNQGYYNKTSLPLLKADVLELPYEDKFSMLIFLPNDGQTLKDVIERLNLMTLRAIFARFERSSAQALEVLLPKFTIKGEAVDLTKNVFDMGITRLFDSSFAELGGMSSFPVFVSNLKQQVLVEVDESGSEFSGWSGVDDGSTAYSERFLADKPFLFMIVDRAYETVVLTGAYRQPIEE